MAVDEWGGDLRGRCLSLATVTACVGWLRRFETWLAEAAGATDAQQYVGHLAREHKPATAQAAADAPRAWSRDHGQEWKLRTPPREVVTAPQGLDRQAQYRLRRAALVALLLLAGLRVSEALALAPADVTLR